MWFGWVGGWGSAKMTTQSMRGTRGGNRNDDLHTSCRAWVYSEDNADDVEARGDKKGGNDVGGGGNDRDDNLDHAATGG